MPRELRLFPFRGSDVCSQGLLTPTQLRGGAWRRLFPDVYVAADVAMDHRLWCRAALAHARNAPGAAISGRSAALVWGVDLFPEGAGEPVVELTVPPGSGIRTRRMLTVVSGALGPAEIDVFIGIALTSGVRTAFDLARRLSRVEAVVALDALTHARVTTLAELGRYSAHLAGRGIRGSRLFAAAVAQCEPLAESPMETRLRLLFVDHGLPRPVVQFEVRDAHGRFIARVDFAYPSKKVAVEYDGDHHRTRSVYQSDAIRRNALADAGWTVVTVVAAEFYRSPERVVERVRRLLCENSPRSH